MSPRFIYLDVHLIAKQPPDMELQAACTEITQWYQDLVPAVTIDNITPNERQ